VRNDQLSQKELEEIRKGDTDAFFKRTCNDFFARIKEVEQKVNEISEDLDKDRNLDKVENKMSILEQEIVDVKNQKQQRVGKLMMTQDQSDKFELLVEELNQLWSFVQRFIRGS